ncbi:hypothetical protein RJT34_03306 [Clitoria ternatea]|uniref:Uncharacterized protein n=1 Tax=Clitoria ternatea TaxID=43366 RepID=A0AAN9Q4Y6_CLITE
MQENDVVVEGHILDPKALNLKPARNKHPPLLLNLLFPFHSSVPSCVCSILVLLRSFPASGTERKFFFIIIRFRWFGFDNLVRYADRF